MVCLEPRMPLSDGQTKGVPFVTSRRVLCVLLIPHAYIYDCIGLHCAPLRLLCFRYVLDHFLNLEFFVSVY